MSIKLTNETIGILKNFANINSSLLLRKGTKQSTIAPAKEVLAEAIITEDIPQDFGIYDLNLFLGNVSMLDNPELDFQNEYVVISDNDIRLRYYGCAPKLIKTPPEPNPLAGTKAEHKFNLTSKTMQKMLKLSNMNSFPTLSVLGEDGKLLLKTHDKSSQGSSFATTVIGETDSTFNAVFNTEHIKMVEADYAVELMKNFARFTTNGGNLVYYVAMEV